MTDETLNTQLVLQLPKIESNLKSAGINEDETAAEDISENAYSSWSKGAAIAATATLSCLYGPSILYAVATNSIFFKIGANMAQSYATNKAVNYLFDLESEEILEQTATLAGLYMFKGLTSDWAATQPLLNKIIFNQTVLSGVNFLNQYISDYLPSPFAKWIQYTNEHKKTLVSRMQLSIMFLQSGFLLWNNLYPETLNEACKNNPSVFLESFCKNKDVNTALNEQIKNTFLPETIDLSAIEPIECAVPLTLTSGVLFAKNKFDTDSQIMNKVSNSNQQELSGLQWNISGIHPPG